MRVVVLGAAGEMGRVASRVLSQNDEITDLILVDRDPNGVAGTALSIRPDARNNVSSLVCDVLVKHELHSILDNADLVLNCSGPFFRVGLPSLVAAIETRTTYIDICDDPDPTIQMFELHNEAKEAGVEAIIGMGASPGVSNLLALRASTYLDEVHDCFTGWSLDDSSNGEDKAALEQPDGNPTGALIHFMEQIHGSVAVVKDGELVRRPPLEAISLDYPSLGSGTGYVVGHPEPVTLHKSLKVKGQSCNLVLVSDGGTAAYLRGLQKGLDDGKLDLVDAAKLLLKPSAMRIASAAITGTVMQGSGSLPPLFALLRGVKDGRQVSVGCHVTTLPRGMAGATSIPAALAAIQVLTRGPIPGVHAPESVIDGNELFTKLIPFCTNQVQSVSDLAPVVVSVTQR